MTRVLQGVDHVSPPGSVSLFSSGKMFTTSDHSRHRTTQEGCTITVKILSTWSFKFGFNYLEWKILANLRHPYLFDFSGYSSLFNANSDI